jgi:hypothetical protein
METEFRNARPLYFSVPIAMLITVAGFVGIFVKSIYSQETVSWAVQGVGQDLMNLIVAVPCLLVSAYLVQRGKKTALFIWLGVSLYILYSFMIYCFALHFNSLFLVYCAVLGLTFYSIVSFLSAFDLSRVKGWFDGNRSNDLAVYFLSSVSILFFLMWMKEIIPALITGHLPQSLKDNGLLINPVHVMDLAFFLPGLFISAILLKRKSAIGYLFGPALVVFSVMMSITVSGLLLVMKLHNLDSDAGIFVVFLGVALASCYVLVKLMKSIK